MSEGLNPAEVPKFEQLLRDRFTQLQGEIEATRERERAERYPRVAGEAWDAGDASVATHIVDTNNAEVRRDADELREVDAALGRISAGSYGICLRCGEPIERARLEAYPAAQRHIACQEAQERESGRIERTPSL